MTYKPSICLLTGLPDGFLAQRLLPQLLIKHPELYVLCLVADSAFDRAHEILSQLSSEERARVELLRGDVSAMDFGMSGAGFLDLAARVDIIHHCTCANQASIGRELEWRHYVSSTGEVLELAAASGKHLRRLVHWSSALLFTPQGGRVSESEFSAPARPRSRDDEMRFRADSLIRASMSRVPITLLRPSIVVGDSKTGEMDRNEGPYALLQLIMSSPRELRLPLPGPGDQPCHFVPIDYVIEAGLAIADHPESAGRTFNITDERPASLLRVFDLINEAAERPAAPPGLARNLAAILFHAPGIERLSQVPRSFLDLLATEITYDSRNTRELLAGTGIECPSVTSYIRTMVDRVRRDLEQSIRPPRKPRRDPHFEELDDPLDA